ncbi:MAG: homoserine dehydrogenase, partial [Clostridiaceae bacterium]|nr:homoserine dehydrogenase [Clostridiaceae bacterium]
WAAQAALYHYYGIGKCKLDKKVFGVFNHVIEDKQSLLFKGFDDGFMAPHSRMTQISQEDLDKKDDLVILSSSEDAGIYALSSRNGRRLFITGHPEYDEHTLLKEYLRDKAKGIDINIPKNYYPNDDETKNPVVTWRSHAYLLYSNWLNYYVYQTTPYDLKRLPEYLGKKISDSEEEKLKSANAVHKVFKTENNKKYVILSASLNKMQSEKIFGDLYDNTLNPEIPVIGTDYKAYDGIIKTRKMIIGLLGYGTIGKGVYDIVLKRDDMEVKYVFDRRDIPELGSKLTHDIDEIINDNEIDTVIELIGGMEPARTYIERALNKGKNVVTANKMMMASNYLNLSSLAQEKDTMLCYTAAVGGAIPWIINLDRASRVDSVTQISGIVNGTTNYILSSMHSKKWSFDYALEQAQMFGYTESDPSADIDGTDICNKAILSANIAFGIDILHDEVPVFGIRSVRDEDIVNAEALGYRLKIFANAIKKGQDASIWIEPVMVSEGSIEAGVNDNYNLVSFHTDVTGKESFYGQGAGRYPTASNVVQDCVDIIYGRKLLYNESMTRAKITNDIEYKYYVRCSTSDSFINSIVEKKENGYYITRLVSVRRMHEWAKRKKETDNIFFASIRNE